MIATTNTLQNAVAISVVSYHLLANVSQSPTVRQATEMAQLPAANITAPAADTTAIKVAIMATIAVHHECDTVNACSQILKSTANRDHTLNMATTSRMTLSTLA